MTAAQKNIIYYDVSSSNARVLGCITNTVNPRYMNTRQEFFIMSYYIFKIKFHGKMSLILNCIHISEMEFKEFERWFKLKPRLKYGWFHLKLYQMFQDLSRRLI